MLKRSLSVLLLFFSIHLFSQDLTFSATGYDMHIELNWSTFPQADRYQVWRKAPGEKNYTVITTTRQLRLQDWVGRNETVSQPYSYFIRALNVPGATLAASDTIVSFVFEMTDDQFLEMVQRYTFRYFWEYAHPVSGMARERLGSDDIVATGGTGFGIMSIIVGAHRGFVTRDEAVDHLLKIVSFLQFADTYHGVFPNWMNGSTGETFPFGTFDDGGDLVETAFLMQGLLTARMYFDGDNPEEEALRAAITSIWEDVNWAHYSRNNSGVLYWHWSPQYAWQMNFPIRGYNEALIVYLLAIASPTHPVSASYWHTGWAGGDYVNGLNWYGIKLFVGPALGGPLFFAHYSYMGFDPRNKKDAYANYFQQNVNHTLINKAWCVDNPFNYEGYGENSWGLTASDDPWGYFAHAPGGSSDNGTLTPAAAIPSMPYTPEESLEVLKHFYRGYGQNLWGHFGFYDAFNPEENWFADSYIAIDQGPIINMIENYRSGILWSSFMQNPEIDPALNAIGFMEDVVSVEEENISGHWNVFPAITEDHLDVIIYERERNASITVVDVMGRSVGATIEKKSDSPVHYTISNLKAEGMIWIMLNDKGGAIDAKAAIVR
jgi:hypothetical protein